MPSSPAPPKSTPRVNPTGSSPPTPKFIILAVPTCTRSPGDLEPLVVRLVVDRLPHPAHRRTENTVNGPIWVLQKLVSPSEQPKQNALKEATATLGNPKAPAFTEAIQHQYRRLSEFMSSLDNLDSEALKVITDNPILSSTSEKPKGDTDPLPKRGQRQVIQQTSDSHSDRSEQNPDNSVSSSDEEPGIKGKSTPRVSGTHTKKTTKDRPKVRKIRLHDTVPPGFVQVYVEEPISTEWAEQPRPKHTSQPSASKPDSPMSNPQLDFQELLSSLLKPLANKMEQLSQEIRKVSQVQNQFDKDQQFLVSNLKSLQANVEIMQDRMKQRAEDHSLHTLPNSEEPRWLQSAPVPKAQLAQNQLASVGIQQLPDSPMDSTPKSKSPQIESPSPHSFSPDFLRMTYPFDIASIIQTVKPFDGTVDSYSLFITRFDFLVHRNPNIDVIMKQNILIGLLEGDAKDLVTSSDLSEVAYSNLRENLEKVYNRQSDRQKQLINSFRTLQFHQTDFDQMDKDVMKHICVVNSLQKWKVAIDDPFLIGLFVEKLPSSIMKVVVRKARKREMGFMETASLIQELISEQRDVASAEQIKKESSGTTITHQKQPSDDNEPTAHQNTIHLTYSEETPTSTPPHEHPSVPHSLKNGKSNTVSSYSDGLAKPTAQPAVQTFDSVESAKFIFVDVRAPRIDPEPPPTRITVQNVVSRRHPS
uniref:CCHC-type domain-containing protein n=1 Tax=Caenorhabditis tropicalis TaxID=1561998 RepID=A0A1I7UCS2_9PELO